MRCSIVNTCIDHSTGKFSTNSSGTVKITILPVIGYPDLSIKPAMFQKHSCFILNAHNTACPLKVTVNRHIAVAITEHRIVSCISRHTIPDNSSGGRQLTSRIPDQPRCMTILNGDSAALSSQYSHPVPARLKNISVTVLGYRKQVCIYRGIFYCSTEFPDKSHMSIITGSHCSKLYIFCLASIYACNLVSKNAQLLHIFPYTKVVFDCYVFYGTAMIKNSTCHVVSHRSFFLINSFYGMTIPLIIITSHHITTAQRCPRCDPPLIINGPTGSCQTAVILSILHIIIYFHVSLIGYFDPMSVLLIIIGIR